MNFFAYWRLLHTATPREPLPVVESAVDTGKAIRA
jgi:hypothetical protein